MAALMGRLIRLLALIAVSISLPAVAGNISFQLDQTGSQLKLTNRGDSSAYYPAVFLLQANGNWKALRPLAVPAELNSGASATLAWPASAPETLSGIERAQAVMVRFFDQAGVGFGQISFFRTPPAVATPLKAGYAEGELQIDSPAPGAPIRATWVLWPQELGIAPIRNAVRFEHQQPPAQHIEWQSRPAGSFRLATGAGQPVAVLVHEVGDAYALQFVPGGGLQGREQRTSWLNASVQFGLAAQVLLGLAVCVMAFGLFSRWRRAKA